MREVAAGALLETEVRTKVPKKIFLMKTVLPSYVPPSCALRLGVARKFDETLSAAMLRSAECGWRALRESVRDAGAGLGRRTLPFGLRLNFGIRAAPDRHRADRYTVRFPIPDIKLGHCLFNVGLMGL